MPRQGRGDGFQAPFLLSVLPLLDFPWQLGLNALGTQAPRNWGWGLYTGVASSAPFSGREPSLLSPGAN